MDGYRIFTFNPQGFPDPKAVNRDLHLRGFHSVWMIDPGAKAETGYSVYDSGTANDVWVKTVDGKEYNGDAWPGKVAWPDSQILKFASGGADFIKTLWRKA